MNNEPFNAVGIDVSKGKSTIAVMRPFGEIILSPFEITHSSSDLKMLSNTLKELDGDTRIIMEYTGKYYQRHISKRGSSELRKTLFQVVGVIQQQQMYEDSVHKFILKKKAEGKPYYVCMIAGCNKFLRIYYARVKEYLNSIENS